MSKIVKSGQEILSENLRTFRKNGGYTQKQLADYLKVDRSTYTKYELDRRPELDTVIQLAALYNVSVDEFLGDYSNCVINEKNVRPFSKASSSDAEAENSLSREELKLLALFRKSIRKNEITNFAKRIAAEDSKIKD
ncbi:MAG: helix-turn-helix transcriptional regulator [Clostridia bacterium]|nr:helix-turn-helix transcriptional regulator [Clostridia bacterium]